jgi:hypothetical protein
MNCPKCGNDDVNTMEYVSLSTDFGDGRRYVFCYKCYTKTPVIEDWEADDGL